MAKTIDEAIRKINSEIEDLAREIAKKKETVNVLCDVAGLPKQYEEVEAESRPMGLWRPDEFYTKPLASSVRTILETRRAAGLGAATLNEIYENLIAGGFKFDAKSDATAKRSLAISLSKNTQLFHKLPNSHYGLRSWYKGARSRSQSIELDEGPDTPTDADVDPDDEQLDAALSAESEGTTGTSVVLAGEAEDESTEDK